MTVQLSRQLEEVLSWRLASEFLRRYPDNFVLIETHPCSGQYDCLTLISVGNSHEIRIEINRGGGSVHLFSDNRHEIWSDWGGQMLENPIHFLNLLCNAAHLQIPNPLPKSRPSTIAYRFIAEFLTHSIGRLDRWECRNGFADTSDWSGGKREEWFEALPSISATPLATRLSLQSLSHAYCYWFLLKDGSPQIAIDTDGRLFHKDEQVHDLPKLYKEHSRVWPLILHTVCDLLP